MEAITIQFTLAQTIFGTLTLVSLLALVQWLSARWISIRLEESIRHEYDKKLEEYRFQQLQRQKAETISRLFSKWIKYRGNESQYLNKAELINFYEELNQMSLELSLWIKDGKILTDIMARLQLKADSKDIRTLVGQVRKLILNDDKNDFDPIEIILWPNQEREQELFILSERHEEIPKV